MKKWMQSLVAAALLVSMVAVEAITPMTAYATETEDEEEIEAEVTEEEPEIEEETEEPEADVTSEESDEPVSVKENTPVYLDGGGTTEDTDDDEPAVKLDTPKLGEATAAADGTKITWTKVNHADSYNILRKKSGGSWSVIGTATGTNYTDKSSSLSAGATYYYTVQAYAKNEDEYSISDYNTTGLKVVYRPIPSLSSASTSQSGATKVSWKKATGASGYAVYRKPANGSWSRIKTTTDTSYTDTAKLKSGKTYYYTVRAYYGNATTAKNNQYKTNYWSGYNSTGKKAVYLSTPSITSAKAAAKGTKVSWKAVSGAKGYAVFRKKSGGSWKMLTTTTSKSYTDKASLSAGKTYYYTVRAYYGDAKTAKNHKYNAAYWSGYNKTGVKSVYLATPKLKGVKNSNNNASISWSKVSSASAYAVYRKRAGGSWKMLATTVSTSYKDTSSYTNGATYYYTVRALKGKAATAKKHKYNAAYWSGYDADGLKYKAPNAGSAMDKKAQSYSSNTKYLILVNTKTNKLAIYKGSKGNWTRKYLWTCTTGKASTPTPTGQYKTQDKGRYFSGSDHTCWYYTRWYNTYLFHSVLYKLGSTTQFADSRLGVNASHGCIRLALENAKWIYDNIPRGTKVVTYK